MQILQEKKKEIIEDMEKFDKEYKEALFVLRIYEKLKQEKVII